MTYGLAGLEIFVAILLLFIESSDLIGTVSQTQLSFLKEAEWLEY
jgi:hypothetical protein